MVSQSRTLVSTYRIAAHEVTIQNTEFMYRSTVHGARNHNYWKSFLFFSDYSDLKQDQKRMEHFTSLYGVLIDFVGESNLPNTAELMGIYGRVSVVWIKLNIFKIRSSVIILQWYIIEFLPYSLRVGVGKFHICEKCRIKQWLVIN